MKLLHITLGALAITGALAGNSTDHSQDIPPDAAPAPKVAVTSYYQRPVGCARSVSANDIVSIHYVATIDATSPAGKHGQVFDSSRDREKPLQFQLNSNKGVPGLEQGLIGMCLGEKRYIVSPPELAYGSGEVGGWGDFVPSGAVVKWDVELMSIDSEVKVEDNDHDIDIFRVVDLNHDNFINRYEIVEHYHNINLSEENEEHVEGFFKEQDVDKDGKVSWEEFNGPKGKFPIGQQVA